MGARFVRLAIAGFKSFADPVSLDILPGLTGVVGPNGCGKSNVAEALRWAMGEANARHLRGDGMDDVIFAGTAHRPGRSIAEVSLHIEDDGTGLPPPFAGRSGVHVTRRIERGVGSTYRVDGREARARDVQTLFADLSSGARSSAMISQGRVAALVNARPEDRRAVLEEAAGITGLHARRTEAETRLRAAEANLARSDDRQAVLDRQLAVLRDQARQATRYRTVADAALKAESALLATGLARAQALQRDADAGHGAAVTALHHAMVAAAQAERAAAGAAAALPSLRATDATARARVERARLVLDQAAAETARDRAALAAAAQRHAQLTRDLAHAQSVLADAGDADARLVAEAACLDAEAAAHPGRHDAARHEATAAQSALHAADEAAAVAAARATEAATRAGSLHQILAAAESRARRAEDACTRLYAEHARAIAQLVGPTRLAATTRAHQDAHAAQATAREAAQSAQARRQHAAAAATTARDTHVRLDTARHKLTAEAGALAEVLAVRDGERWPAMLDRLDVPPGLEAALAAALGEDLAAADDPAAPRHWRPLPTLHPTPHAAPRLSAHVSGPAALGRALAGVGVVASDPEGDAAQRSLQPGQSLVSAAGAYWRWDGYTVRAGAPSAAAVRLRHRNRLANLRAALTEAEAAANAARTARCDTEATERTAAAAEQAAHAASRAAGLALDAARTLAQALQAQADAATQRVAATTSQRTQADPERDAARDALAAARHAHNARSDPATLHSAAAASRTALLAARTREAAAARALDALDRATQARDTRRASIGREREDRRMRASDLVGRVADLEARSTDGAAEHAHLADAPNAAARRDAGARAGLAEAEALARASTQACTEADQAAAAAAAQARTAEHAAFAARDTVVRAEAARDAGHQALQAAQTRIAEREGALPPPPTDPEATAAAEDRARAKLQRLLRERDAIGPVNLLAAAEADAAATELATLTRERDELATAMAKLRGSIGHLNREGRERLSAIYEQVDRHFQALFSRMFGGGRAHLAMLGSDDPLEAGLEIYAQPPGKKLSSLSLLSGGEQALTALSLTFAVFRCNPAPLCVLDEVDAPLDDANVDRFCALLADMAEGDGTRFLVVTHHGLTMARMDRLYGVTMQERGISRVLSVDLSDAVAMTGAIAAE